MLLFSEVTAYIFCEVDVSVFVGWSMVLPAARLVSQSSLVFLACGFQPKWNSGKKEPHELHNQENQMENFDPCLLPFNYIYIYI